MIVGAFIMFSVYWKCLYHVFCTIVCAFIVFLSAGGCFYHFFCAIVGALYQGFDGFSCYLRHEYMFDGIRNIKEYKPCLIKWERMLYIALMRGALSHV
jgi:hypothetical protein